MKEKIQCLLIEPYELSSDNTIHSRHYSFKANFSDNYITINDIKLKYSTNDNSDAWAGKINSITSDKFKPLLASFFSASQLLDKCA